MVPRILVVFFMPEDESAWVTVTEESLTMRRAAFWMSLRGAAPSTNVASHRVHLPPQQSFDPLSLRAMLVRVCMEQEL